MTAIFTNPRTFTLTLLVLNICAAVAHYAAGDIRRGLYWPAASVLNATLIF